MENSGGLFSVALCYIGPPISLLKGLDKDGYVLYPALKLGYLVVPKPLVSAFTQAHYDLNRPGQSPCRWRWPSTERWATSAAPYAARAKPTPSAAPHWSRP